MLGAVPEEKQTRGASRYDAIVATFIALLAVCVSGYTAYMQRQQVRGGVANPPIRQQQRARHSFYAC
jgi:uncharacterized iron-regulated membrane protein